MNKIIDVIEVIMIIIIIAIAVTFIVSLNDLVHAISYNKFIKNIKPLETIEYQNLKTNPVKLPEIDLSKSYHTEDVILTAYTASFDECGKTDGITASGVKAVQGITIASDHLPMGTKVEIDNHIYTVQDRFGGGHTNKIDIFMNNKRDAINFGKQYYKVKIFNN